MKLTTILCLILVWPGLAVVSGKPGTVSSATAVSTKAMSLASAENLFDLSNFGAVGDGVSDDGPALQNALNEIARSGGGTLFVPAGRYAILTPVEKDFTGLADSVVIQGVYSSTAVTPPNLSPNLLGSGLDLVSEFAPRTHEHGVAIRIIGLRNFLMEDIGFIGTPNVATDALITLDLSDIGIAKIRHCEFYGLSSKVEGGAIVRATRSDLQIEQSKFLGSFAACGYYTSVVENLEWKGISVAETHFVDYGERAELYGKSYLGAALSWINIGNAAAPENNSPRREVVLRDLFLDEGGYFGLSSLSYRYSPPSAAIDLVYISGLFVNVSNFGTTGHYLWGLNGVLIENSHYGWSHNASSAIAFSGVANAILDQVECVDGADRISADSTTGELTILNSIYTAVDSQARATKLITTQSEADPVQYVRQRFVSILGRPPDAAAHYYWSNRILQCRDDSQCIADQNAALLAYLNSSPSATFTISGEVTDEKGAGVPNVTIELYGSQAVATRTDANGRYFFSSLPTSGVYSLTTSAIGYAFNSPSRPIATPNGDQVLDFVGIAKGYSINGRVLDPRGRSVAGAIVTLAGSQKGVLTTDASGNYNFAVAPGGDFTVTVSRLNYSFSPSSYYYSDLDTDQAANFIGTPITYSLYGTVGTDEQPLRDVTVTLSGSQSAVTRTDADGNYSFAVWAEGTYTVTPTRTNYLFWPDHLSFTDLHGNRRADFESSRQSTIEFSASNYEVSEGTRTVTVTVTRSGNTSKGAKAIYSAIDGSAQQRSDVTPVIGELDFGPGETSKSFTIFITDDAYVEGEESLTLKLSDEVGGDLGDNSSATLTITDDDSVLAANPIDDAQFFVRQHYRDFLNRPPDTAGLAFWSNQITSCGNDAACLADRRINVSAAFFLSIEFQETGFLVYRLYRAAFARDPQHLDEFLLDTRTIGAGVIVGSPGWQQLLETEKTAFIENFVTRARFTEAYPLELTPAAFVNQLNANAGTPLATDEIAAAVNEFEGAATSEDSGARARVLRRVAENQIFSARQTDPALVLMQYFGYLQRSPDESPDNNLDGYTFWLNKLDEFGGDFRRAEMVKAFILSDEYRARFGSN